MTKTRKRIKKKMYRMSALRRGGVIVNGLGHGTSPMRKRAFLARQKEKLKKMSWVDKFWNKRSKLSRVM